MDAVFYLNLAFNGVVEGLVIGLAALALNLVFAVSRFPNAATGDLLTVGAYAGIGMQALGATNVIAQGLAAVAACVIVAVLYYLLVFRKLAGRPMIAPLSASIGLAFFTRSVIAVFVGQDQHIFQVPIVASIDLYGVLIQPSDLWLCAIALVTVGVCCGVLQLTRVGRRMRAVADNPQLAQASGIRPGPVMLTLWVMVGAVSAIAGLILGIKTSVMPDLGWNLLLPAFAAAVLGGVGNPAGAVLGGVLLGVAQELSTPWLGFSYKIALSFVVLAALLLWRPQGLFGAAQRVR